MTATSAAVLLNAAIAGQSPPRTAFFNGRLLSAEDLQREQALRESGQAELARLIGCGIAWGFDVSAPKESPLVTVGSGLGVTPSGSIIDFAGAQVDLSAASQRAKGAGFSDCAAAFDDLSAPTAGLYLLVLTPSWVPAGRAPSLLGEVGSCNRNVELPAVRVRLVALTTPADATADTVRNRLAFSLLAAPAGSAQGRQGWLPQSAAPKLGADDLPLATLKLDTQAHVTFVDRPAAQRRLAPLPGNAGDALWPESRVIEIEAFARQSLTQLIDSSFSADQMRSNLVWLPPVWVWQAADSKADALMKALLPQLGAEKPQTVSNGEFVRQLQDGLHSEPISTKEVQYTWLSLADRSRHLVRVQSKKEIVKFGGAELPRVTEEKSAPLKRVALRRKREK